MKPDMTDDQERELTERIAEWIGPIPHRYFDTGYDGEYCLSCECPNWHDDTPEYCEHKKYLTSRDDWAFVEDEIERRGLWEKYIILLISKMADDLGEKVVEQITGMRAVFLVRRASPLVCAQAWDEMMKEVGE